MHINELQNLLNKEDESSILEFKKSTGQIRPAAKTLCAFLNGSGGSVIIGITDHKEIIGQTVTESTKRDISTTLAEINPFPTIEIEYLPLGKNNKHIIILRAITDSTKRPYTFDNRAYIRRESTTQPMPREYYQQLIINNVQHNFRWENGIVSNASIDDLDIDEILKTIHNGISNRRIPENYSSINDPVEALKRLKLLNDEKITNATIILFAKNPTRWFPQCCIKLARFKGTNKQEFIDNKRAEGNIFKILNEAMIFANQYLPISSRFTSNQLERIDQPLFPTDVLREIFSNAVCHRDYSIPGGSINFAIYDDRLEIWNNGILVPGLTFQTLKTQNESLPRNPLIANVLYYRNLFESWGRGINLIVDKCLEAGHPEPEFFERSGGFCVQLNSKSLIGEHKRFSFDSIDSFDLIKRHREILQLLKLEDGLSSTQILERLKDAPTDRTLRNDLNYLEKIGLIRRQGQGPSTVWYFEHN